MGRTMNKRERVITEMNGKEVDHVPAGLWFHFGGDKVIRTFVYRRI